MYTNFQSSLFKILSLNDDTVTAFRVKVCNMGNRTTPQFNMLQVTRDVFVEN